LSDEAAFHFPAQVSERLEIDYYGNFDLTGARSPDFFLKSLAGFLKRFPEARDATRFVFYEAWLAKHDSLVDELGL
jgi:hypothetical protein